ncbi:hypothetical protein L211DRAFT_868565 [Terfezia boudieri ATCC MYA-4762]|uniref:Uncharacterized protein n=1 Tax=Terfezia boudieri ATCC MYA-4762 TaxID=1051890 RepID=A0A3N4LKK0_9PEZI|nr:hypothetical protein L211DRAFT_868565 [Terfezia boudieri ATCC MYA-4762]
MSASPLSDSNSQRAYDLRTRTITYMLSAFEATNSDSATTLKPNPVLVKQEADLYPSPTGSQDADSTSQVNPDGLRFLNQVASLLVREHEVVAVLPKRSGPQAHVNVMVTTDCDPDPDEPNPRNDSPPGKTSNVGAISAELLSALEKVTTLKGMYEYLIKYRHVSFSDHVSSIECLLNRIIAPKLQLKSDRKLLLERYITFRAAPKMHRRFKSLGFTSFLQALKGLTTARIKISVAFYMQKWNITSTTLTTKNEAHEELIPAILYFADFESPESKCPYLWEQYEKNGTGADVVYTAESASEFHKVLIYSLEKAAEAVAEFTNTNRAGNLLAHDDDLLTVVEEWMRVHIGALDGDITELMRNPLCLANQSPPPPKRAQAGGPPTKPLDDLNDKGSNLDANTHPSAQEDEDNDGGLSDTAIEISAAQAVSRAGQQSLWLAVSFQHAIGSVCQEQALPKNLLSLILFNPPVTKTPSTQMESWKDVVTSLFPTADISSATSQEDDVDIEARIMMTEDAPNITAKEVIETLEAYGKDRGGKSTLFLPDHETTIKFRGVYHAESIIATMAYLSSSITSTNHQEIPDIHAFKNTYRTIGVSKRCCPICTKLLSLLTHTHRNALISLEPLTVLCSHPNIYPTSLPPLVPSDVAERLVKWLEELLKDELVKLVKKKRRSSGVSVESATSQDSKGESPKKQKGGAVTTIVKAGGQVMTPGGMRKFVKWGGKGKKKGQVGERGQGQGLKASCPSIRRLGMTLSFPVELILSAIMVSIVLFDLLFIAPAFKDARTSVMFWGAVEYGYHSPLFPIRKQTASERTYVVQPGPFGRYDEAKGG